MLQNARETYLENRVLSADGTELVRLLYQASTAAVREARRHLSEGHILERSRSITKASEILLELAASLDHERGGEISRRLASLYEYMLRRLNEANMQQSDPPLAEVLGLLATLSEAWEAVKTTETKPPAAAENVWQSGYGERPEAGSSPGWSL
jgi:flagellar secretion chaperone FliS